MPLLTVFTPTYNRAHTLPRTYESLCHQTCDDFEWLVVDDGSTDDTRQLVQNWIAERKIPIRYLYKENGGLHTGYTAAFENIESELNVCIDSDDYMPYNAVEIIKNTWISVANKNEIEGKNKVGGIIGLDFYINGDAIGGQFPFTGLMHMYEMGRLHNGDVKIVCRTDILKRLPKMPVFNGEKNFNPIYYYVQIDRDYVFRLVNENLCFVDYQSNGMSINILNQFRNSPRSFAQLRRLLMSMPFYPYKRHFKNAIHYVSSCIFSKQWDMVKTSPRPLTTIGAIPFGILLNLYIRHKTRIKK